MVCTVDHIDQSKLHFVVCSTFDYGAYVRHEETQKKLQHVRSGKGMG